MFEVLKLNENNTAKRTLIKISYNELLLPKISAVENTFLERGI